ncbi:FAD-linked oxidoreductase-like protein [Abortiporus biennis]|nr:FAD-linked oxidoreductase-like protein [Abortiporus biennis]
MSSRLLWRAFPQRTPICSQLSPSIRQLSSQAFSRTNPRPIQRSRISRFGLASGVVLASSFVYSQFQSPLHADTEPSAQGGQTERSPTSLADLIRTYVVYTACSFPSLVDNSPKILSTLMSIPVLREITEAIVRITFFDQFVGGDTAHEAVPVMESLRAENKGCLLVYSVEVDEEEAAGNGKSEKELVHKRVVEEMIRSIEVAADFEDAHSGNSSKGRRTWVATAMLPDAQSLLNLSKHIVQTRPPPPSPIAFPGNPHATDLNVLYSPLSYPDNPLSEQDIVDLKDLHEDLFRICTRAQERGVKVIIDAEHSWYTPAIDAFTLSLMRKFNKLPDSTSKNTTSSAQPLIYATYQAYLRRTPEYIAQSLACARAENYSLGIKLVRGAYHPHEMESHEARHSGKSLSISPDELPPVWGTKPETDTCYNECLRSVIDDVALDIEQSKAAATSRSSSSTLSKPLSISSLKSYFTGAKSEKSTDVLVEKVKVLESSPPTIGVLFGSHNWDSMRLVLQTLQDKDLATVVGKDENGEGILKIGDEVTERLTLAQLYGMSDALTNYIVDRTRTSSPMVLKYLPYGALANVMPYLSRRAIENKSVLGAGGATVERERAAALIKKRLFG